MRILCTIIALLLSSCATASSIAAVATLPEVRSPQNGQHIGEEGDPQCEPRRPCSKIRAEGWVPAQRKPFFVVAPIKAAPMMWVQPLIVGINADGTFSGLVHLGESNNGARQYFKIFVLACDAEDRFFDGQEISEFPGDCEASAPVEVYRER